MFEIFSLYALRASVILLVSVLLSEVHQNLVAIYLAHEAIKGWKEYRRYRSMKAMLETFNVKSVNGGLVLRSKKDESDSDSTSKKS